MTQAHDQFLLYYHEFKDKLFNYLMVRLSFDREQAEDLLMDVVLKAYERFDSFDPQKGTFKTWIFTLTHNHLVNFWRDQSKKQTASLDSIEEGGLAVATVEPEDIASADMENEKIRRVLLLLDEQERSVISMRYFEELEYSEIAEITGKNEGAIRTSLSRAMKRFSEMYKKIYS